MRLNSIHLKTGLTLLGIMLLADQYAVAQVLPDTAANRRRGVVGCTQSSSGIDCSRRGGGGGVTVQRDYSMEANNRGVSHANAGRYREAIAEYRAALGINSGNSLARQNLAYALSNLGNDLLDSGNLDDAMRAYQEALVFSPGYANALNGIGITLARSDRKHDALDFYRRAAAAGSTSAADNLANLENALRQNRERARYENIKELAEKASRDNRTSEAISLYQKALAMFSGQGHVWAWLGDELSKLGRLDEAEEAYRNANENGIPNDIFDLYMGRLQSGRDRQLIGSHQGKEKIAVMRALARDRPGRRYYLQIEIAEELERLGLTADLEAEYRDILATAPSDHHAYRTARRKLAELARVGANKTIGFGDPAAREAALRKLAALSPDQDVSGSLAKAIAEQGRYDEAMEMFHAALEKSPNDPSLLNNTAYYMTRTEPIDDARLGEATQLMRRAVENDPSNQKYRDFLEWIEYRQSFPGRARARIDQMLDSVSTGDFGKTLSDFAAQSKESLDQMFDGVNASDAIDKAGDIASGARDTVSTWTEKAMEEYRARFGEGPQSETEPKAQALVSKQPQTASGKTDSTGDSVTRVVPPLPEIAEQAYRPLDNGKWSKTLEPIVSLNKRAIVAAREVMDQAEIEAYNLVQDTVVAKIAESIRYGQPLKSLIEKGKEVYGDMSSPIYKLYAHDMQGLEAGLAQAQGADISGYKSGADEAGERIIQMTKDLKKKSIKWHTRGGGLLGKDAIPKPKPRKPGFVAIVRNLIHPDEARTNAKTPELAKWYRLNR